MNRYLTLVPALVLLASSLCAQTLPDAFRKAEWEAAIGLYYYGVEYEEDADDAIVSRGSRDNGYGTGYVDARAVTHPFYGVSVGAAVIGVAELYEKNGPDPDTAGTAEGDWDRWYSRKLQLRELFLQYNFSDSFIRLGRQEMDLLRFNYTAAEGVALSLEDWDRFSLLAAYFYRGVLDAGRDVVSDWADVSDIDLRPSDSDSVFALQSAIHILPEAFTLTPCIYYQPDGIAALDATAEWEMAVGPATPYLKVDYHWVNEDTEDTDLDDDWTAVKIEPGATMGGWTLAAGYHRMSSLSDTRPDLAYASWLDDLNPLTEGPHVYDSGAETYYAALAWEWEGVWAEIRYGRTDGDAGDANEWDLSFSSEWFDPVIAEAYVAVVDDDQDAWDYTSIEVILTWRF